MRVTAGLAGLAVVVAGIPGVALTDASWVDDEHAYGALRAQDCAVDTDLASRASGRMVAGSLAGVSLDPVVALHGIVVSNDGATVTATAGAGSAGPDAFLSNLTASAIGAALLGAGLSLPLGWSTGAWTPYGRAQDTGVSTGAAGAVTDSGAIDTSGTRPGAAPGVGSLALSSLPFVGSPLAGLADVSLDVGAVASTATLDGCADAWTAGPPTAAQLQRSYLVSHVDAGLTSAALASLMGATGSVAGLVNTDLSARFGTPSTQGSAEVSVLSAALGSLTTVVSGALSTVNVVGLAGVSTSGTSGSVQVVVDTAPVVSLLTTPTTDGVVTLDLASGRVKADLGALAGGLENRAPNTPLLTSAELTDLTARVNTLLLARIAAITGAVTTALQSASVAVDLTVKVKARAPLLGVPDTDVLAVSLGLTGTLKSFVDGTATSHAGVAVTGPTVSLLPDLGLIAALAGTLSVLLQTALGLLGVINPVLTTVLDSVQSNAYDPVVAALPAIVSSANGLEASALATLSSTLTALSQVLSVTLNAQPDQAPFPAAPYTGGGAGEYFVSALRVGVLDGTGAGASSLVNLFLATSSVGANA